MHRDQYDVWVTLRSGVGMLHHDTLPILRIRMFGSVSDIAAAIILDSITVCLAEHGL